MEDSKTGNFRTLEHDDSEESGDRHRHRRPLRALFAVLLGVVLVGAATYCYFSLQNHGGQLARLPGIEKALTATSKQIEVAEEKLRGWDSQWDNFRLRLSALENKMNSSLQAIRQQARELAVQNHRQIQLEMDQRTAEIRAELNRIQVSQKAEQARVANLEEQIAVVRGETAKEIGRLAQDTGSGLVKLDRQFASVDQKIDDAKGELHDFARKFDRQRVDFEAGVNHERELAPGVNLRVEHTDIEHQRFSGWVWLMPDRRTLWVHGRGAAQPLVFYSTGDGRPRELVITRVTKYSVVGYLLLPAGTGGVASERSAGGD